MADQQKTRLYTDPSLPISGNQYNSGNTYQPSAVRPVANKTVVIRSGPDSFAWLVVISGTQKGRLSQLSSNQPTIIGRDMTCDFTIDDPAISRQHAKIKVDQDSDKKFIYTLHDLATENGTQVNGETTYVHGLTDGDRIQIGTTVMVFKQVHI